MSNPLNLNNARILVVDDDVANLQVVKHALSTEGYDVKVVDDGTKALYEVNHWHPHLVILDVFMPNLDGLDVVKRIRRKTDYISTLFLSAKSQTKDVVQGLDAGADDYICKPFKVEELLARVRAQLRIKYLQDQLANANHKLKQLVEIDDLTGLYNMRSLYDKLDGELSRCRRYGRSVAVVMMDMDHFKNVNDDNDHLFGSYVLSEVGMIITKNVRKIDHAARYGGDEFLIILSEIPLHGSIAFCERLRKSIEESLFSSENLSVKITCSLGFALSAGLDDGINARELVKIADRALYEAKDEGRNCICYYDLSIKNQNKAVKVS